jgi:hypothetical protein
MPPEILALLDKPLSLIVVLFVGALAGMTVEQFVAKQRRAAWREKKNNSGWRTPPRRKPVSGPWTPKPDPVPAKVHDAADQLRTVMAADFTVQPLLNRSEAKLFASLDRMVLARNPAWQVMAQVSLGEVLRSTDKDAYRCINSKRVDLMLVDGDCQPRHAIEYQGGGHHQGSAAARDAVKKEALRRAGVGYHEVVAGVTTPAEVKRLVERLVPERAQAPTGR